MRKFATVYTAAAIWIFGWTTGVFGLVASSFLSIIILAPVVFSWRMATANCPIRRHEYGFLALTTLLAISSSVFIVVKWYETGMDRVAMFEREFHAFHRHIKTMPEFRNVDVSYTTRKGGRVYLSGRVATRLAHEELLRTIESMIRNNRSGYSDGVEYPDKSRD